jgi:ribonuclease T2
VRGLLVALALAALGQAAAAEGTAFILAVSWQPAFCEGHADLPECRSQSPLRHDADRFSLHGLWPQPKESVYCRVPAWQAAASRLGDWQSLPSLALSAATRQALERAMPGTMSALDRHEWVKHGTCSGFDAEAYYAISLRLLDDLNGSAVRLLMAERRGRNLTAVELRRAFDRAFGAGAGSRVRFACVDDGGRRLISEMTLGLGGDPAAAGLADLLLAARPTDQGCPGGIIDRPGLQ